MHYHITKTNLDASVTCAVLRPTAAAEVNDFKGHGAAPRRDATPRDGCFSIQHLVGYVIDSRAPAAAAFNK